MDYLKEIPQFNSLIKKQQAFLMHYYSDSKRVGSDAAKKAGYNEKTAVQKANALLKDKRIAAIIKLVDEKLLDDNEDLRVKIVKELCLLAFSNITEFMTWAGDKLKLKDSDDIDAKFLPMIAEIKQTFGQYGANTSIKMYPKIEALKELNKMHGFYAAEKLPVDKHGNEATLILLPANGREKQDGQ